MTDPQPWLTRPGWLGKPNWLWLVVGLLLLFGFGALFGCAPLAAQTTLDSVRRVAVTRPVTTDSVTAYYTRIRTDTLWLPAPDTAPPPPPPPPPDATQPVPFGAFATAGMTPQAPLSLTFGAYDAASILNRIANARAGGFRLMIMFAGGKHENYMSSINGVLQFDSAKWFAKLRTFDTPAIRAAVADAVADGTIVGSSVMDEPHVCSGTVDGGGNTWGPCGTMTKVRVDSLCAAQKALFPALAAGVVHRHDVFEPTKDYRVCDLLVSQYAARIGSVTAFRDAALIYAARSGIALAFSLNVLDGGTQDRDGTWDCTGTGGKGTSSPNCRMTAAQLETFGTALGAQGCALLMWRHDGTYMSNTANQAALRAVSAAITAAPRPPCSTRG